MRGQLHGFGAYLHFIRQRERRRFPVVDWPVFVKQQNSILLLFTLQLPDILHGFALGGEQQQKMTSRLQERVFSSNLLCSSKPWSTSEVGVEQQPIDEQVLFPNLKK